MTGAPVRLARQRHGAPDSDVDLAIGLTGGGDRNESSASTLALASIRRVVGDTLLAELGPARK